MWKNKDFQEKIENSSVITQGIRVFPRAMKQNGSCYFYLRSFSPEWKQDPSWQAKKFFPLCSLGTHLYNCLSLTHMPLYLLYMPIPDLYS